MLVVLPIVGLISSGGKGGCLDLSGRYDRRIDLAPKAAYRDTDLDFEPVVIMIVADWTALIP
ncbi:MAG TPA: hypothetical protein VFW87_26940 [Pirellulales bacterium]|nr:hypothetical protein [Pirellulales bacterium]